MSGGTNLVVLTGLVVENEWMGSGGVEWFGTPAPGRLSTGEAETPATYKTFFCVFYSFFFSVLQVCTHKTIIGKGATKKANN